MNPATVASLCTLRMECSGGGKTSVGTGFLYQYKVDHNGSTFPVPMLLTNKHVVRGMDTLKLVLSYCKDPDVTDLVVRPEDGTVEAVVDRLQTLVIDHPDPHIDLCGIPVAPIIERVLAKGIVRHAFVERDWHLPAEEQAYTRPVEPILMIGYPNGLWDQINNRPIARKGITASHPLQPWNGKRQFVIDCACFPGSSGSPVFLFEDGMFRGAADSYAPGTRARFIGVLFAGPQVSNEGKLEERTIPTSTTMVPVVQGMMNLGFVIHADAVDDLMPILTERVAKEQAAQAQRAVAKKTPDYSRRW